MCRLQYVPLQNKLLGKGAYGHVCAIKNSETGERLAVKKVKNAFDDVIDAKRVLREIRERRPPPPSSHLPAAPPRSTHGAHGGGEARHGGQEGAGRGREEGVRGRAPYSQR